MLSTATPFSYFHFQFLQTRFSLSLSLSEPEISDFEFVSNIVVASISRRIKAIWSDFVLTDLDLWLLKMENLISLVNKIQRACTALGDHGEASALPTLWDSLPAIAVVGGQVCFRSLSSSLFLTISSNCACSCPINTSLTIWAEIEIFLLFLYTVFLFLYRLEWMKILTAWIITSEIFVSQSNIKHGGFCELVISLSDFAIEFVLWIRVISRKFCSVDRRWVISKLKYNRSVDAISFFESELFLIA